VGQIWVKLAFCFALLLCVPAANAADQPSFSLSPADPAQPVQDELQLGDILLSVRADRSVYSPGEPVLIDLAIANTSEKKVTLKTVGLVVGASGDKATTTGIIWLPGKVQALRRNGKEVWSSGAYDPPQRVVEQKTLPERSRAAFHFLWPQLASTWEVVRPGDYLLQTQFFVTVEGAEGGFPTIISPIGVSSTSLHPSSQVEKEGLTWRVDVDRDEYQLGQSIRLKLTASNVGKEPLIIWWRDQFLDSCFVISDSQGKEVWTNLVPKEKRGFEAPWPTAITFPPGECRLVSQAEWDGKIESPAGETGAPERSDAPPGEYTVNVVPGFPSLPALDELKFTLAAR
jgi:hypothetical protein